MANIVTDTNFGEKTVNCSKGYIRVRYDFNKEDEGRKVQRLVEDLADEFFDSEAGCKRLS